MVDDQATDIASRFERVQENIKLINERLSDFDSLVQAAEKLTAEKLQDEKMTIEEFK